MKEARFRQRLRENGFDDGQIKAYPANTDGPMHTHDFSVMLLVIEGPFALATEAGVTTFEAGDICELPAGIRHVEQTGPGGARVLLGKKLR